MSDFWHFTNMIHLPSIFIIILVIALGLSGLVWYFIIKYQPSNNSANSNIS